MLGLIWIQIVCKGHLLSSKCMASVQSVGVKSDDNLNVWTISDKPVVLKKVMREGMRGNRGGRGIRKTHSKLINLFNI